MTLAALLGSRTARGTKPADWNRAWEAEMAAVKYSLGGNIAKKNQARTDMQQLIKKAKGERAYLAIHTDLDNELAKFEAPKVFTEDDVDRVCDLIKNIDPAARATVAAPALENLSELLLDNITDDIDFTLEKEGTLQQGHKNWNNATSINKVFKNTIKQVLILARQEYAGTLDEATLDAEAESYKNFFAVDSGFTSVMNTDTYNNWLNSLITFARANKVDQKINAGAFWASDTVEEAPDEEEIEVDRYELRLLKVLGNDPDQKDAAQRLMTGEDILQSAVGLTVKAMERPVVGLSEAGKIATTSNTGKGAAPRAASSTRPSLNTAAKTVVQEQMDRDRKDLEEVFGKPLEISPITGTNPLVVTVSKINSTGARKELLEYQVHLEGSSWGEVKFVTGKNANELFQDPDSGFSTKAKVLGFIATQTVKTSKRVGDDRRLFIDVHGTKAADITIIAFSLMHSHVIPVFNASQADAFHNNLTVLKAKKASTSGLTNDEARVLGMAEKVQEFKNKVGGDKTWKDKAAPIIANTIPDTATIRDIETQLHNTLTLSYEARLIDVFNDDDVEDDAKFSFQGLIQDAVHRTDQILAKTENNGTIDNEEFYKPATHIVNTGSTTNKTKKGGTRNVF